MPFSDWLHTSAVRGCLIAGILIAPALAQNNQTNSETPKAQTQEQQANPIGAEEADAALWKERGGSPDHYRETCQKPKDRQYAELCQQWRMAEAAGEQVVWARRQFWASVFGIIGVIATIIYTHLTLRLTNQTTERQLRAYFSINPTTFYDFGVRGTVNRIDFKTRNHGQTPAYRINHTFQSGVYPNPFPSGTVLPAPDRHVKMDTALFPDLDGKAWFFTERPLTEEQIADISANRSHFHIWGISTYEDTFGRKRTTKFHGHVGGRSFSDSQHAFREGRPSIPWDWEYGLEHNQGT